MYTQCLFHMKSLSDGQIFYIWQPYMIYYIYDCLSSPCLAETYLFLQMSKKYFTVGSHICSFTSIITYVLFV